MYCHKHWWYQDAHYSHHKDWHRFKYCCCWHHTALSLHSLCLFCICCSVLIWSWLIWILYFCWSNPLVLPYCLQEFLQSDPKKAKEKLGWTYTVTLEVRSRGFRPCCSAEFGWCSIGGPCFVLPGSPWIRSMLVLHLCFDDLFAWWQHETFCLSSHPCAPQFVVEAL